MTLAFSKSTLILIDYTAKIKDTDKVFDTTIQSDAEKHDIYEPDIKYGPKLVSIDDVAYPVLKGLDEELAKTSAGDKLTVEVPPAKAFGERDSSKVRMMPARKLGEDADKLSVGDTIEVDHKTGIIKFMGSGRVKVDYNHAYAGKTILYDVNVIKALDTDHDKLDAILNHRLPAKDAEISFDLKGNEASVPIPERLLQADGLQFMKHFIQQDAFHFIPTLEKINFVETYPNKQMGNKDPGAAETDADASGSPDPGAAETDADASGSPDPNLTDSHRPRKTFRSLP